VLEPEGPITPGGACGEMNARDATSTSAAAALGGA
jgi:hypothetical protein